MFAIYDFEHEGYISIVTYEGCCFGYPAILFPSEELAEAFLIWFCAWNGDDEDSYRICPYSDL